MVKKLQNPYEVITLDSDDIITVGDIKKAIGDLKAVTLCVRTKTGEYGRGGYFFSIVVKNDKIEIQTFDGQPLTPDSETDYSLMSINDFAEFINHVSGREYSEKMFELCVNHLNFKSD